jgi:hypothetical protein
MNGGPVGEGNIGHRMIPGVTDQTRHRFRRRLPCFGVGGFHPITDRDILDRFLRTIGHEHRGVGGETVAL